MGLGGRWGRGDQVVEADKGTEGGEVAEGADGTEVSAILYILGPMPPSGRRT